MEGKERIRIFNDLGAFYTFLSFSKSDVFYYFNTTDLEKVWQCSFGPFPIIINKDSAKYLESVGYKKVSICPQLPAIFVKAEKDVLEKYNYTLEAHIKVFELYKLLYLGKYFSFIQLYSKLMEND